MKANINSKKNKAKQYDRVDKERKELNKKSTDLKNNYSATDEIKRNIKLYTAISKMNKKIVNYKAKLDDCKKELQMLKKKAK
jgi:uncharacterized coiled-coil DUF342 family protein